MNVFQVQEDTPKGSAQHRTPEETDKAADMSGGDVMCSGWLRKSPPEKKLRRYVSSLSIIRVLLVAVVLCSFYAN